jgi:hypothetical protein
LIAQFKNEKIKFMIRRHFIRQMATGTAIFGSLRKPSLSSMNSFPESRNSRYKRSRIVLNAGSKKQLFIDGKFIDSSDGIELNMNPPIDFMEIDFPELKNLGIYGHAHGQSFPILFDFEATPVDSEPGYKHRYRMYYHVRPIQPGLDDPKIKMLCMSESDDLIKWQHTQTEQFFINGSKRNNVVLPGMVGTVFLDPKKTDGCSFWFAGVRNDDHDPPFWKEIQGTVHGRDSRGQKEGAIYLFKSREGITWKRVKDGVIMPFWCDPPSLVLYDPRIDQYVLYARGNDRGNSRKRFVARAVSPTLNCLPFSYNEIPNYPVGSHGLHNHLIPEATDPVLQADGQDPPKTDIYSSCMNIYPWAENVYLAFPSVYRHYDDQNSFGRDHRGKVKNDGVIEVQLAVSRDGIHFYRFRKSYIAPGIIEDESRGGCVFMGVGMVKKEHYIYQVFEESVKTHRQPHAKEKRNFRLAVQRLDGFVSADAGSQGGSLTTPTLTFTGNRLKLNVDCSAMGEVWVEIQDKDFKPIDGFSLNESVSVDRNGISQEVWWRNGPDIGELAGRPVRLHIKLRSAKLFAFQFT